MVQQTKSTTDSPGWSAALRQELEGFVRLELAAEDMVKDEAALVSAWLADDVTEAGQYLSDVGEEVTLLEQRALQWLLGAADSSRTDWLRLSLCLQHGADVVLAGERHHGPLSCQRCGAAVSPGVSPVLEPCANCGCCVFQARRARH